MSESYICECGERVDPKGSPHDCPGTPTDRLDRLEEDMREVQRILAGQGREMSEELAIGLAYRIRRGLPTTEEGAVKMLAFYFRRIAAGEFTIPGT